MSSTESTDRSRHIDLPTQQHRLRHLRSIAARNISTKKKVASDEVSQVSTYFTLHCHAKAKAFYTSEKVEGSLNPTWRGFNLGHLVEDLNTAATSFVVRVWQDQYVQQALLIEWQVDLTGLVYLGDQIQRDGMFYEQNTLIFGLTDGFYGAASRADPSARKARFNIADCCLKVDQASVKNSYNTNSLSRIYTVLRAIKQTQAMVNRVRTSIELKLAQSQDSTRMKAEQELLVLKVNQLRSDLEWRTMQLQAEKEANETQQAGTHQRDVALQNRFDTLQKDKSRLQEKRRSYFDVREEFIKAGAQLVLRRKQLISELALIYPISETQNSEFTICGVRLPNSEDFSGQDETMIAVALGYTCHLVEMISHFLDVPLRYPVEHRGSRSRIRDHVLDKLSEKERDFPLYSKGKERFQFNYGVYLLNKNIAQLRYYCGLGTTDLRLTLPNLKSLLELRLGVKFEPHMNQLTVAGSRAMSLTSTGSPTMEQGDPTRMPAAHSDPSPRSEGDRFEELLSETKQEHANEKDRDSNLDKKDTDIKATMQEAEIQGDDLFKPSPDSFFQIKNPISKGILLENPDLGLSEKEKDRASQLPTNGLNVEPEPYDEDRETTSGSSKSSKDEGQVEGLADKSVLTALAYEDEVVSSEGSTNATYGSKFKLWPKPDTLPPATGALHTQQESKGQQGSPDEVTFDQTGTPGSDDTFHVVTDDELAHIRTVSQQPYPLTETDLPVSTFKTKAMRSNTDTAASKETATRSCDEPEKDFSIITSKDYPSPSNNVTSGSYDSIEERTNALSSNIASFKLTTGRQRDELREQKEGLDAMEGLLDAARSGTIGVPST